MAKGRVAAQRAFTVTWVSLLVGAAAGVLTALGKLCPAGETPPQIFPMGAVPVRF